MSQKKEVIKILAKNEGIQIDEFILDNEESYIITYKDSPLWGVTVFREGGFIIFAKSGVLPETVDKFEASYDGRITKIYLNTTDIYGSHREYIGETEDHQSAMEWVCEVNQIYFNRKSKELAEAA